MIVCRRAVLVVEPDSRAAVRKRAVGHGVKRCAVQVNRQHVTLRGGFNHISIVQSWPAPAIEQREAPQWAVPPNDLRVLRTVARAAEIKFVSGDRVCNDRRAKPQLHFLVDAAVLIHSVNRCLRHLVGIPGACQHRG